MAMRPNPNVATIQAAMDALGRDHELYGPLDHAAAELAVLWARERRRITSAPDTATRGADALREIIDSMEHDASDIRLGRQWMSCCDHYLPKLRALAALPVQDAAPRGNGEAIPSPLGEWHEPAIAPPAAQASDADDDCQSCQMLRTLWNSQQLVISDLRGRLAALLTQPVLGQEAGAPAAMGRGNVMRHRHYPTPPEPLSDEAMRAHREEARRLGHPIPGPGPNEAITPPHDTGTERGEAVAWPNGCDRTIPAALRYLATHERPTGGQDRFNAEHLLQLAREMECATKLFPRPAMQASEGAEIGLARYEYVRRLNGPQFADLVRRNIAGERFDDMVDAARATQEPSRG